MALAGRREGELQKVADEIARLGATSAVLPTDVSDPSAAERLVTETIARFGRLDAAFNNAGITSFSPIEHLELEAIDRVMATNVRGTWLLMKHEIAAMRALGNGGAIVNTSSIAATGGTAGLSAYAASKAALDAFVRVLALEAGPQNIRVNNVSPGVTLTPMNEGLPEPMLAAISSHTALKRLGQPEEVSDVAVWLCSDAARYVTGQSLLVDGGFNIAGAR